MPDAPAPRITSADLLAAAFSGRPAGQLPVALIVADVGDLLRTRADAQRRRR
jgi:hypothetical protein